MQLLLFGENLERWQSWSIASDLKSDEVQASVGSNPTFSDKHVLNVIIFRFNLTINL